MNRTYVLCVAMAAACGSKGAPPAAGSAGSAAPGSAVAPEATAALKGPVPPGVGGKVELPPPTQEARTLPPQKFRHSSVRGDFRVYKTTAGIVVSWRTGLSARSLDGKSMWKTPNQGRAVAVSPDGARLVSNNSDGDLVILDANTGTPIGAPTKLGGTGDDKHPDVWISAFAWLPDGKSIVALDSKHAYLLGADGAVQREIPIKCKEDCFLTSAVALSNDAIIVANGSGTSGGQLLEIKLADGSTVAAADFDSHDVDLATDHSQLVVDDGSGKVAAFDPATLAPRWTTPLPGFHGVKTKPDSAFEWKAVPKLSPDGRYVVVNDAAGRLWLLDAKTGTPALAYPTELVDFVEDAIWLDGATLVAIDNPGHVLEIAGTPAKVVWSEMDGPEDGEWDGP